MITEQNPIIPAPMAAVEIDAAIFELELKLSSKLEWLTHHYGRAYRHLEKNKKNLYFPEVYQGNKGYHRVTPDNDKTGMCFFVVGEENDKGWKQNNFNWIKWDVGIIFWVNLELINNQLLETEIFTQNLIKEVREVLNRTGFSFSLNLKNVKRELNEIYREFNLREDEEYLRAPYSGFRMNLEISMQEDCINKEINQEAILNNFSLNEKLLILESLDFTNVSVQNALTVEQINVIKNL